jgi:translation initiation factor 2A
MTWEIYTENPKDIPKEKPNLFVFRTETGEEVFSVIQKRQTDWECHWSSDESMFALMIGGEVLFYEIKDGGFEKPALKMGGARNGGVSISPYNCPPFVGFYVPGTKGAPSMCKIYKYPNVNANQPVSMKSFFQADKVDMMWNQKGNGLLLLTSTGDY